MPTELSPYYHVIIVCCDDFYAESVEGRLRGKKGIKSITLVNSIGAINKHIQNESTLFIIYDKVPGYEKLGDLEKYCDDELRWKVMLVTESANPLYINMILQSELCGCLLKGNTGDELLLAIRNIAKGLKYYSWQLLKIAAANLKERQQYLETFENREPEIFELMCKRKKVREMAVIMKLKDNTVKGYRSDVIKKVTAAGFAGVEDCGRHFGLIDG